MSGYDIVYIATKAHVYRTYLIKPLQYIALLESGSILEFYRGLSQTAYRKYLLSLKEVNGVVLRKLVKKVFEDRTRILSQYIPDEYNRFMRMYLVKMDIDFVLKILSEKEKNMKHAPVEEYGFSFSRMNFAGLLSARSIEEVIKNLPRGSFGRGIDLALNLWRRFHTMYIVELALLKGYYETLVSAFRELPDIDQALALNILGVEVDAVNIAIALGPILYGYSPNLLDDMLIRFSFRVSPDVLKKAYGLNPKLLVRIVPPIYKNLLEFFLFHEDHLAVVEMQRLSLSAAKRVIPWDPVGFSYIFAVIKFLEIEYRNLISIIEGIVRNIPRDLLRKMVIF